MFKSIQTGTHLSQHKPFLLHKAKINRKGEQLQEPLPRLIQDDTGEAGNNWVRFEESLALTLFVSVNGEESHCCFTEGLWLSGGMSIESQARREGEEDRWLGLWTQQRPPLILHWVSICFASLPKAITQLPFFHPFLWEPLAFFFPVNRSFLQLWKVVFRCGPSLIAVIWGPNCSVDRVPGLR